MADLTTYEGLKAAVADYLGRDDMAERIPAFIRLAEQRMNRELRLRVMEKRAFTDFAAGDYGIKLPARRVPGDWNVFMEMRDLVWRGQDGQSVNLSYMPPDLYRVEGRRQGRPKKYTIIGDDLFFSPRADAQGVLELTYYAEIPPLGEAQRENAVLLHFPDLYLYASLVESGPFTRGSAPLEMWTQYYAAARQKADANEQRARFTANITMKPVRRIG